MLNWLVYQSILYSPLGSEWEKVMARKTKEDALRTRQLLIESAIQQFAQRGVTNTTLTDIADAAGVTRGAVYWHFSSKAELFNEMWQQQPPLRDLIQQNLATRNEQEPLKDLRQRFIAGLRYIAENPRQRALMQILYQRCEFASDMSDAAGTMWMDVARRDWSDEMLAACGLSRDNMPALFEGCEVTGSLRPAVAQSWNMPEALVVAGGGDNAAGAVGVGMADAGQAMLSLGTSGVYFAVSDGFLSKPESAVHSFCHALPGRWHLMSVMLSAASCLDWAATLTGLGTVPALIAAAEAANDDADPVWFLPYLSGERTPHNNPQAKGVFFGLTHQHGPAELARAVLEGVGYALADGMDVVHACGVKPESVTLIGGGARSAYWRQMLADISGQQLDFRTGGDVGPALGAARLAQLALHQNIAFSDLLPQLPLEQAHRPDAERFARYAPRRETFRQIYQQLLPLMS